MRAKTLVLFVIAAGCGLVASIGVSQYMDRASNNGGVAVESAKIFVAMTDINIGEKLDVQNVKLDEWPKDRIPAGAVYELEDLEDRFPRTRLYAGEPILTAKLMDSNDGSKAVDIPAGYRVVSVKVSMESSVSGLVQPGDRVDLLVFLRKSSEVPETGTRTILRDVNVFAVDSETERRVDNGVTRNLRTVSLLVQPDQAEAVNLASELGELSLTLRRPDDKVEENSEGVTVHSLLGNEPESANDDDDSMDIPDEPGFVDWLTESAEDEVLAPPPIEIAPLPPEPETIWTMEIVTPDGHREFVWYDADELPEEVGADMGPLVGPPSLDPGLPTSPPPTGVEPPPAAEPAEVEDEETVEDTVEDTDELSPSPFDDAT